MGAAFDASFARTAPRGVTPAGQANYDDDDDGLGGGAVAAIAAGGALGLAAALGLFGGAAAAATGYFAIGAPHDCQERYPTLPEDHRSITAIRLVPESSTIEQGFCRCFHLEVRSGVDRKWYSVTQRAESRLDLRDPSHCVIKMDGQKNVFCVPLSAPQTCNGQSFVVNGTFAPTWMPPATAEARIVVRVPSDRRFTAPTSAIPAQP
jgi:hypothetical protein